MKGHAPLAHHGALLTRPAHQVSSLQQHLLNLGAKVICHPTMDIQPKVVQEDIALEQLEKADWVIFTSQNAVNYLPENICSALQQRVAQKKLQLFAMGESTATCLLQRQLPVLDYPREKPGSESLYVCLNQYPLQQNILIVGGEIVRPWLAEQLQKQGLSVQHLSVYQRALPEPIAARVWRDWEAQGIDTVVFTSGEGFLNGIQLLKDAHSWLTKCLVVVISERLAELVREQMTCRDLVVAKAPYDAEIVRAVLDYWQVES